MSFRALWLAGLLGCALWAAPQHSLADTPHGVRRGESAKGVRGKRTRASLVRQHPSQRRAVHARSAGEGTTTASAHARRRAARSEQRKRTARIRNARRQARQANAFALGTSGSAGRLLLGGVPEHWLASAREAGEWDGSLDWPVEAGWFLRGLGAGSDGRHGGIDIGGTTGWDVRAAGPGFVAYAGDELSGYGNVVMIVHDGGWVTLYAHNSVNVAVPGQQVQRGEVIAALGSTGQAGTPHVHFELLFRGERCDPAPLMRQDMRHYDGKPVVRASARWVEGAARPAAIRCVPGPTPHGGKRRE